MSALRRVAVAAAVGAVLGPAWLILIYGAGGVLRTDFDESPPRLVSGLYPAERETASGLTFAWTTGLLTIRLPDLDRRLPWQISLRARAARANPAENPDLTIHVDGTAVLTTPSTSDFSEVRFTIPARPERRGATMAIESSATVVPGPHDPRPLGVMLDHLEASPAGIPLPPRGALRHLALTTAITAFALAALGCGSATILLAAFALAALLALVTAHGFAPYTAYPGALTWTAGATWFAVVTVGTLARVAGRPPSRAGRFLLAFSALAIVVKMAVLLHPHMPLGDAMFQAHRFHEVLGGRFYFTSIAPGNYSFPYAPGLYVLAMPFAGLVPRGAPDMTLLRAIVVVADAVAAGIVCFALTRAGGGLLAAGIALAIYHLVPLDFQIITVGNLTNAFAQAVAAMAFAVLLAPVTSRRWWAVLLLITLVVAFLSHTSTFAIGACCGCLVAALFVLRGTPELRRAGMAAGAAVLGACVAAVVIYYGHFTDTYRAEWARIGAETASAAPDAGGRSIAARASAVPRYVASYWGIPITVLSIWGFATLRAAPPAVRLTVLGWAAGCVMFLVLGVLTPVDMRHYLAVIPALSVAAGMAAASGWRSGGAARIAAAALVVWAGWIALRAWWGTLV